MGGGQAWPPPGVGACVCAGLGRVTSGEGHNSRVGLALSF